MGRRIIRSHRRKEKKNLILLDYIDKDSPDIFYRDVESKCLKPYTGSEEVFLSIVIPTYKRAKYLEEAIESALNQRNVRINYEIVVVNNDPQTDMSALIEKYKCIPNISFYVNGKNIGMMGNWNRLLMLSKGKWIAYCHDDDMVKDDYISEMTKILKNDKYSNAGGICVCRDYVFEVQTEEQKQKARSLLLWELCRVINRALISFRYLYRKDIEKITPYKSLYLMQNIYNAMSCGTVFSREKFLSYGGWHEENYPVADWYTSLRFNEDNDIYMVRKKLGISRMAVNASLTLRLAEWFIPTIRILQREWKDEKVNKVLKKDRDIAISAMMEAMTPEDREEVCRYFNIGFKRYSKLRLKLHAIKKRFWSLMHNIDWELQGR